MKTMAVQTKSLPVIKIMAISSCFIIWNINAFAQDVQSVQTIFGPDTEIGFIWSPEIKVNSIQNKPGTLIGFYGGALINKSLMLGGALGSNFGHPTINYSYLGLMGQYTFKPEKILHPSAQIIVAAAKTKDYEQTKSNLFDNFGNTNGTPFYFIEPGINLETNIGPNMRLVTGLSYRHAFGLDARSEYVEYTRVTSRDMSGLNLNFGVKFGLY